MKQPHLGVPCLPGYKIPTEFSKKVFNKKHTLDYYNGYTISTPVGEGIDALLPQTDEQTIAQLIDATTAKLQFGSRVGKYSEKSSTQFNDKDVQAAQTVVRQPVVNAKPYIPSFAALDKVVLRFDAYIAETLPDGNRGPLPGASHAEQDHVIRHVLVLYYVEDDSIAVVEPPVENSGLPQGVLIKRQLLPKPIEDVVGAEVQYYTIDDFALAKDDNFYGKIIRIVGCDLFTEKYLRDVLQKPLNSANPAEPIPEDPYLEARARAKRMQAKSHQSHDSQPHTDKLKKFLENDRKVLRFYCVWDDRESLYGEVREFVIHYFLVDDCMEVREVQKTNSGRDPFPIMLRRQMLPKHVNGLTDLAGTTPLGTDLDVEGYKNKNVKFYTWRDIRLGSTLNVLGRQFLVYDCDEYTRKFYIECSGASPSELHAVREHKDIKHATVKNGDGEAQTNSSDAQPVMKKSNFHKMLANEGKVLRFAAHLESKHKEDHGRRFVVVYRLADDTMSIYEPTIRNAGILGGKFMARALPVNPGTKKPYQPADFFVGGSIEAYSHSFIIVDADEFVFKWMEERPKEFPQCDLNQILPKIKALSLSVLKAGFDQLEAASAAVKGPHAKVKPHQPGQLTRDQFVQIVKQAAKEAGVNITEHEIITVARRYAVDGNPQQVDIHHFVAERQ